MRGYSRGLTSLSSPRNDCASATVSNLFLITCPSEVSRAGHARRKKSGVGAHQAGERWLFHHCSHILASYCFIHGPDRQIVYESEVV